MTAGVRRTASRAVRVPCTVDIAQLPEALYAHVTLGGTEVGPGDVVTVDDPPAQVAFGTHATFVRTASVVPAGWTMRLWTRLAGYVDLLSLCEVGFSGRDLDTRANHVHPGADRAASATRAGRTIVPPAALKATP